MDSPSKVFKHIRTIEELHATLHEDQMAAMAASYNRCFGSTGGSLDPKEYYMRVVDFLHNNLSPLKSTATVTARNAKSRIAGMFGTVFRAHRPASPLEDLKQTWELYVLLNAQGAVTASCFVHLNRIYHTAEIHEVCVNPTFRGKHLCQKLIEQVVGSLTRRFDEVSNILIFCEKENIAARKCYESVFRAHAPNVVIRYTEHTIAFMLISTAGEILA